MSEFVSTPELIRFPSDLPCPQSAPMRPTERRHISEIPGPANYRAFQRDFHGTQDVVFIFNARESQIFAGWWRHLMQWGGGWFVADWPLLYGRIGNVYRILGSPRWEFIADGRMGLHRVSARVEIRGRGMPPQDAMVYVVTSRPYPVMIQDAVGVGFDAEGGQTFGGFFDNFAIGFGFEGGTLRQSLITYSDWPADEFAIVSFDFEGGTIRQVLIRYEDWPPDELEMGFDFSGGTLQQVLIRYTNWIPEGVQLGFDFEGGTLT